MQTLNNENNELLNREKEKYNYLPDINLHSPYQSRGMSENQRMFNNKIEELIKEKFENKPINQDAIKNKYLRKLKGNIYTSINPYLQAWKELKTNATSVCCENSKENLMTNSSPRSSDNNRNTEFLIANTAESLRTEDKISQLKGLYQVENFKKKYAYKNTLKILMPYNSEKYKKMNFIGNENKINNMLSPYKHKEYSPDSKSHNLIKDGFKKHAEEVLKFKHLERGENKKSKQ